MSYKLTNIICIGASAGGLEALQAFLRNLPELKDTAIIVAQHLSPRHKSMLVQLLSKETNLTVKEIKSGESYLAKTVYITPPDKDVSISQNKLQLRKPSSSIGPKPSFDLLLKSLSKNEGFKVIAIVLSGTGTDGVEGIKALKDRQSFVIVQDPKTAKYDGMPLSAISTRAVDAVLPPEKMGEEIRRFLDSKKKKTALIIPDNTNEKDVFGEILEILSLKTGTDFSNYKIPTMSRRLEKRMQILGIGSIELYLKYIHSHPVEIDELFKIVLIGVTQFFRDDMAYEALTKQLEIALHRNEEKQPMRIWVPACSTGEEAYSIAILLHQLNKRKVPIQIFATDIDDRAISHARKGIYNAQDLDNLSQEIKERFFIKRGNKYEIIKLIRSLVLFSKHDVTKNPPFLRVDLISCRNLLIYFNAALQQQVLPIFHYSLNGNGILFLGMSETVGRFTDLFKTIDSKHKIFQRKRGNSLHSPLKLSAFKPQIRKNIPAVETAKEDFNLSNRIKDTLYNTFDYPYVVVDQDFDIQEINGDVRLYVSLTSGNIQVNLIKMVNPELQIEVRSLLTKSSQDTKALKGEIRRFELFGTTNYVRVHVKPLIYKEASQVYFIVVFENLDIASYISNTEFVNSESIVDNRVQELEKELDIVKGHLQVYIEELETSNEELQSLNEELQSTNEELQSSNEELETTNEELQSTNEEIQIAYSELKASNELLIEKEKDIQNKEANTRALLNNEIQAFILLDDNFKILEFNKRAIALLQEISHRKISREQPIFNFIPESILNVFLSSFNSITNNQNTSLTHEVELEKIDGQTIWLLLNFTVVNEIADFKKISLGLLDITTRKQSAIELNLLNDRLKSLLDTQTHYVLRTDLLGNHTYWNKGFEEDYGWLYENEGIHMQNGLISICTHHHLRAKETVDKCFAHPNTPFKVTLDKPGKNGTVRTTLWEFTLLLGKNGEPFEFQCLGLEITDLNRLSVSEERFKHIVEINQSVIWETDGEGKFTYVSELSNQIWGYKPEDLVNKKFFFDLTPKEDRAEFKQRVLGIMEKREHFYKDINRLQKANGEVVTLETNARPFFDSEGNYLGYRGSDMDMTAYLKTSLSLKQNLDLLSKITAEVPGVVYQYKLNTDGSSCFPYASIGMHNIYGFHPEELKTDATSVFERIHPEDVEMVKTQILLSAENLTEFYLEFRYTMPDGREEWRLSSSKPERLPDGSTLWHGIITDITKKKEDERRLKESENKLHKIIDNISDIIILVNQNGKIVMVSPAAEKLTGFKPEELIGKEMADVIHPDDIEEVATVYKKMIHNPKKVFSAQYRHIHKTKEWIWLEGSAQNFINEDAFESVLLTCRDISYRKKTEIELLKFKKGFEQNPVSIVITNLDGNIEYVNTSFEKITGYSKKEVIGKNPRILKSGYQSASFYEKMWSEIACGREWKGELYNKTKDGRLYWESAIITPILDAKGKVVNYLALKQDITAKKMAEKQLKESEEKYRIIADHTSNWEFWEGPDGELLYISPAVEKITGYKPDAFFASSSLINEIIHPNDRGNYSEHREHSLGEKGDLSCSFRIITKGGQLRYIEHFCTPVYGRDEKFLGIRGSNIDVTAKFEYEQKLRESENRFRRIFEEIPTISVQGYDENRIVKYWNKASERVYGYSREEAVGKKLEDLIIPNEMKSEVISKIKRAFEQNKPIPNEELVLQTKDGNLVPVLSNHIMIQTLAGKKELYCVDIDLSNLKEKEKEIRELLDIKENQNARLLDFTHIVSHNLRSHTANMQGILSLIEFDKPEIFNDEYISLIKDAANNLDETLRHLNETLNIKNKQGIEFKSVEVNKTLKKIINSISNIAKLNDVEIINETVQKEIIINTVPAYLESIVLNLLTNAIKFKSSKRASFAKVKAKLTKKGFTLTVEDNGLGIDLSKYEQKLFGMYKTFHEHSDSKGLGLFITKNQVDALNGEIKVKSKVEVGTTFIINLPQ